MEGKKTEAMFYHPRTFEILRLWLALIPREITADAKTIMDRAKSIDPLLSAFLTSHHFPQVWHKLQRNFPSPANLLRQFHVWFDGLKTFKLIRFLTAHCYQRFPMNDAFAILMTMIETKAADISGTNRSTGILTYLRLIENGQEWDKITEIPLDVSVKSV